MSAAFKIISDIRSLGGSVEIVKEDRLRLVAPQPLPDKLTQQAKIYKPEIIQALLANNDPCSIPHDWMHGVVRLQSMTCPKAYKSMAWSQVVNDSIGFIRSPWAYQAYRLAWGVADLFGVNPDSPYWRYDGMGLIPLLQGRPIGAITETSATIRCPDGAVLTFCRLKGQGLSVPLWKLSQNNSLAQFEHGERNGSTT